MCKYVIIWTFPLLHCFISQTNNLFSKQISHVLPSNSRHLCVQILGVKPWLHWSPSEIHLETTMAVLLLFISDLQYELFNEGKLSRGIYSNIILIFQNIHDDWKRELYFTESMHTVLGTSISILADLRCHFYSSCFVHGKNPVLFCVGASGNYMG